MRSSLKRRIVSSLSTGVLAFIPLCVMYKFFLCKTQWLLYSVIWSIAWMVGHFVSKTLATIEESVWKRLGIDCVIILLIFLSMAFIFNVVCGMADWPDIVYVITFSFGISTIFNNQF